MEDRNLDFSELAALGTAFILISSIMWVQGYNAYIDIDLLKYFTINDYFNLSIKSIAPSLIGLAYGATLKMLLKEVKSSAEPSSKYKLVFTFTILNLVGAVYILGSTGIISRSISQPLISILLIGLVFLFATFDLGRALPLKVSSLIQVMLAVILFAYPFGMYVGRSHSSHFDTQSPQTFIYNDNKSMEAVTLFVLSEYWIVVEKETTRKIALPKDVIETIIE